ncbi:MAG TPA: serine acetyltransferase [Chloroflexota bacterium]|nr:serine acetyltransferase [Chloroflexota bacterium]
MKPTPDVLHRLSNRLYRRGLIMPARIIQALIFLVFSAVLPADVSIGKRTRYAHGGVGVVLNSHAKIGDHVMIAHGVTIGGRSRQRRYPIIEDDVFIGTGAKILGDLTIGHHSIIGANSVVLSSIPPHSVAVGIPARVIQSGIDPFEIEDW